jgi:hypothetical protein
VVPLVIQKVFLLHHGVIVGLSLTNDQIINCVDIEFEHFNGNLHSCWFKQIEPLQVNSASTFS